MYLSSPQATLSFAQTIASKYQKVLLIGELGVGKTTFSKGFAMGLGLDPNLVQSPTYSYMHVYEEKLLHIDMYRIEDAQQLYNLGLLHQIDVYTYILIERPKWTEHYIDNRRVTIEIKKISDLVRSVNVL